MQPTPAPRRPHTLTTVSALLGLLASAASAADQGRVPAPTAPELVDPVASAKAHRLQRLEAEVAAIEERLGELPPRLDIAKLTARSQLTAAEYETWLLDAERQGLRARLDHLQLRIVLLEEIEHHQELEDRARVVALQNAIRALNSDHSEAADRARRASVDLNDAVNLIAERVALHERLADVDHEIRELSPALHASAAPPASAPAEVSITAASAAPFALAPAPPPAPSATAPPAPGVPASPPSAFTLAPADGTPAATPATPPRSSTSISARRAQPRIACSSPATVLGMRRVRSSQPSLVMRMSSSMRMPKPSSGR